MSSLYAQIIRVFPLVLFFSMMQCVHAQDGVAPQATGTKPSDTSGIITVDMPADEPTNTGTDGAPATPGNPLSPTSKTPVVVAQDIKYFFKQLEACDTLGQNTMYFDLSAVGGPRMWMQKDNSGFCRMAAQAAGSRTASICQISKDNLKLFFPDDSVKKILAFDLVKNDLSTIADLFKPLTNCAAALIPAGESAGEANLPKSTTPDQSGSQNNYDYGKLLQ